MWIIITLAIILVVSLIALIINKKVIDQQDDIDHKSE
jgi:hypothetical protein